jgi:hypothetical protein
MQPARPLSTLPHFHQQAVERSQNHRTALENVALAQLYVHQRHGESQGPSPPPRR